MYLFKMIKGLYYPWLSIKMPIDTQKLDNYLAIKYSNVQMFVKMYLIRFNR